MTKKYTWADIDHFQLTGEAMIEIANKVVAERAARRKALGVPEGLEIPPKPIPATKAECIAEIAALIERQQKAYEASISLPPGPERESAGAAMVCNRDRRVRIACAIRDGEVV